MQGFLKYAICEEDEQVEIVLRVASMLGPVLYKCRGFDFHLKHKEQIINFYKFLLLHPEEGVVQSAVYNLPCMHLLF